VSVPAVLPWHADVLERVQGSLRASRLPTAFALICPAGWGLVPLTARVVQRLTDLDPAIDPSELAHQDVRWIEPEGSVIKVDQIRKVNDFAVQTVQSAPRKVVAILEAERLNPNAANALLKMLEEPPPNTHLILATESWGQLLPTIKSRCQRFEVRPDRKMALSWLQGEGLKVDNLKFAWLGYAPLAYTGTDDGLFAMLSEIEKGHLPALKDSGVSLVALLACWYRSIIDRTARKIDEQEHASAQSLQDFAEAVLDVRRQLAVSNAANENLLLESLISRWKKLGETSVKV